MKFNPTPLLGAHTIELEKRGDDRGFFARLFCQREFESAGIPTPIVQINNSLSAQKGTLRGLHYQLGRPQGKLIGVLSGELYDVAVDLRRSSPTFGKWTGFRLSGGEHRYAWIPTGFGHGFLALSEGVEVVYKLSEFWAPDLERVIRWDDPDLAIRWPFEGKPVLSKRDGEATQFRDAEVFP